MYAQENTMMVRNLPQKTSETIAPIPRRKRYPAPGLDVECAAWSASARPPCAGTDRPVAGGEDGVDAVEAEPFGELRDDDDERDASRHLDRLCSGRFHRRARASAAGLAESSDNWAARFELIGAHPYQRSTARKKGGTLKKGSSCFIEACVLRTNSRKLKQPDPFFSRLPTVSASSRGLPDGPLGVAPPPHPPRRRDAA